ncbi:MAG: hypothetical protein HYY67_09305 [Thaumarchaeota archaeon]|nr:hypothetical protein [Nitrososphaerota archaeon]
MSISARHGMTDWLPWGFVLMVGLFATTHFALESLGKTPVGQTPNLSKAGLALKITILVSAIVYAMYIAYGERWLWY